MELFAPENLPGVGMGDLQSIAAICGMLGLAATAGMLVAEGWLGSLLFGASAVLVLAQKDEFGGAVPATVAVLALLVIAVAARLVLQMRARRDAPALVAARSDAPETRQLQATVARRERWARLLTFLAVLVAGAAVGFAWAEWNEVPFALGDTESLLGLGVGLVAAAIGGDAAWRFLQGSIRAGGSPLVVGVAVAVVAYVLNALSFYVPFVGAVVLLLLAALALRLHRRDRAKFAGLRILS